MNVTRTGARLGASALALAGLLFLLFPLLRPWHDESTVSGAVAAFGSAAWLASHMAGALGFVLVPLGLLAVLGLVARGAPRGAAGRWMVVGLVLCWLGTGLLLPFYGAEAFGLNVIAGAAAEGQQVDVLALAEGVRMGPVALTTFGLGLLTVAIAAVVVALAVGRSGRYPRYAGVLFAAGYATYLPQFFGPPWLRIAHGAVLAVGLFALAVATLQVEAEAHDPAAPASGRPER